MPVDRLYYILRVVIFDGQHLADARFDLELIRRLALPTPAKYAVGLNTPGLLLDRLSVIAIRHRRQSFALPDDFLDAARALSACQESGPSAVNRKPGATIEVGDFSDVLIALHRVNFRLWYLHERPYGVDVDGLDDNFMAATFRDVIRLNRRRSDLVAAVDRKYWLPSGRV